MMTEKQKSFLDQLQPKLEAISKLSPHEFVQRERLGAALSFEFAEPIIKQTIDLFSSLLNLDWSKIPAAMIEATNSQAAQALQHFDAIRNFDPGVGNADAARRNLGDQLEGLYHGWYVHISQFLRAASDGPNDIELEKLVSATNEALARQEAVARAVVEDSARAKQHLDAEIAAIREEATREAKEKLVEVEKALESVRKLASEAGVSQHALVFDEEARRLGRNALVWLVVCVIVAFLIALLALNIVGLPHWGAPANEAGASNYSALQPIIEKGTISLLLFFALIMAIRNYSANRHNEIVNRHRMNALRSFETFARAASDEATKNVVLIQATQAIFAPQATGYVKSDGENSPSTPIVELIRSVGSGEKK